MWCLWGVTEDEVLFCPYLTAIRSHLFFMFSIANEKQHFKHQFITAWLHVIDHNSCRICERRSKTKQNKIKHSEVVMLKSPGFQSVLSRWWNKRWPSAIDTFSLLLISRFSRRCCESDSYWLEWIMFCVPLKAGSIFASSYWGIAS